MKNILLTFFLLACIVGSAQRRTRNLNNPPEVIDPPRTGHAIGAVLSSTNGNGLSYRYWPGKVGVHLTCFPSVSENNSLVSFGTTVYRTIREYNGNNKFFLQVGMDYVRRNYDPKYSNDYTRYTSDSFNLGFGPGFESHSRYGSFSCYLGYGIYNKMFSDVEEDNQLFTLSGGISYFFEI